MRQRWVAYPGRPDIEGQDPELVEFGHSIGCSGGVYLERDDSGWFSFYAEDFGCSVFMRGEGPTREDALGNRYRVNRK